MNPLKELEDYLNELDKKRFRPVLSFDETRLHVLNPIEGEYYESILEKCDELGLSYDWRREPVYNFIDENVVGFSGCEFWFEKDDNGGYREDLIGEDKYGGLKQDLTEQEVVDLLNTLVDENKQLKSDLDYFERTYEIEERGLDIVEPMCTIIPPTPSRRELLKENGQLKQRNQKLEKKCDTQYESIQFYKKEIERLKGDVE